jgi:hypothetical protein
LSEGADKAALGRSYSSSDPLDKGTAEDVLKEVKHIMDQQGVSYFLRQGTCLGAIRDGQLISWDDDLDIGSVLRFHGVTEKVVHQVVEAFKNSGFHVQTDENDYYISVALMKSSVRTDWACYRVIGEDVYHYPGIRIPARLFNNLKEIDFIGERFLVPNPPEEYLLFKYGPDWETPKKAGFEKDILQMIPEVIIVSRFQRLKRFIARYLIRWRLGRIRILDHDGSPVAGAEVIVAGQGRSRTGKGGYGKLYLPMADFYALVIRFGSHEEILYQEQLTPGKTYVYKPDPLVSSGRMSILSPE